MKIKICHVTSAHDSNDIRIFVKECTSLANAGYEVYLVAKGSSRIENHVNIIGVGDAPVGRRQRMTQFVNVVYEKAVSLNCDVYHFHDPELLPYGVKLKQTGKNVIFDSHEDVPAQIMDKYWIPWAIRGLVSSLYRYYETNAVSQFDAVITATDYIAKQFTGRTKRIVAIKNYPKLDDIEFHNKQFEEKDSIICYAGGIDINRGEQVMIKAMENIDAKLLIAGDKDDFENQHKKHITYLGRLNRKEINELYGKSVAGLVLLLPIENYVNSLPIKLFEYMAAGLPVIASDFDLWRRIIDECRCGICVNPNDNNQVVAAICKLLNDRKLAQEMGLNGRKCVMEKYNWKNEEEKLLSLYQELCI